MICLVIGHAAHGRVRIGTVAQPRTLPECTRVQPASSISYSGIAAEDLLEAHPHLEAGERGAEAHVDAVAEADVLHRRRPVDVELVGPIPHPLVAVRRTEEQQHLRAFGHLLRRAARPAG